MITILTSPNKYMAAYNQVPFTISSDNTEEPNFNFVIDINEIFGSNNPLARLKYPVQLGSNQLTFDIGSVLKNYVSQDFFNATGTPYATNRNSRIRYWLNYRELYDVSGIPTLSGILGKSPTTPTQFNFLQANNCIFDFEEYSPNAAYNLRIDEQGFCNDKNIEHLNVENNKVLTFFDPAGEAWAIGISSGNQTKAILLIRPNNENIYNINAGKILRDFIDLPIVDNTYEVQISNLGGNILASKTFVLHEECSQYKTTRLHWLNKMGGWDSFNFNKNTKHSIDIERKQFKAPMQIGYAKSDRLKQNYNTTITDRITINSDWISEEQSILLEQLATSPVIFLERASNDFVAVNIINQNYEVKKYSTDRRMFNVTFEIEYTYNRYRQTL